MTTNPRPQGQSARMDKDINAGDGQIIVEEKVVRFNGDISIKKYLKGKFLGKGGFAKCYEFTNTETKRVSAAKIIDKTTLTKSRAK